MKKLQLLLSVFSFSMGLVFSQARNPVIHADVPDMSVIRVGDTYYMASTTMHMVPGLPIMKSKDLVNWEIVGYAYEKLVENNKMDLVNEENAYGAGSWAPCLRYHEGIFYASTFSATSGKTHIFKTKDIENGPWEAISFAPSLHDHSIFFDDDGRAYIIWGAGRLSMAVLKSDLSGIEEGSVRTLIANASAPAGSNIMLPAEGSQMFKVNGKYYIFNITWPRNGMRTVIVHRADKITGPYESRLALQDRGIAQGGLIDTPGGQWFAYLFRDFGAVGRIPYLAPVTWEDGWPVIGEAGKVPDLLPLPESKGLQPGLVASDAFDRKAGEPLLPRVWQWNHNPDPGRWSLQEREGFLRLKTGKPEPAILQAKNMLTQRTAGPICSGITAVDVAHLQEGDRAGFCLLQKQYGWMGVQKENGQYFLVMASVAEDKEAVREKIPVSQTTVWLKVVADFTDRRDVARFSYSTDAGGTWHAIGQELKLAYTLPHFMGYRFGLFCHATQSAGGYADFDFFRFEQPETGGTARP